MPRRTPEKPRRHSIDLALVLIVVAALGLGPRVVDGYAALQWTRYYVRHGQGDLKVWDYGHRTGRVAARAVERLAPLPQAGEAARLGLEVGQALQAQNAAAALTVYTPLRVELEAARANRLRGLGLGAVAAEVKAREDDARSQAQAQIARP